MGGLRFHVALLTVNVCCRTAKRSPSQSMSRHLKPRISLTRRSPDERGKQVRVMLQDAASIQLNDYFEFLVGEAREELDGAPEGGSRYPVDARMDGRGFG